MRKGINTLINILLDMVSSSRVLFWSLLLKKIGTNVTIRDNVIFMSPQNVEIGHDVLLNAGTKIGGQNGVKIGNYVQLSYNVNLVSEDHSYDDPHQPIKMQGYRKAEPIIIEDDTWIGANAVILPGIKIGRGSIVGANAVVTTEVPPYSIVGGVPAKLIKRRFKNSNLVNIAKNLDLS